VGSSHAWQEPEARNSVASTLFGEGRIITNYKLRIKEVKERKIDAFCRFDTAHSLLFQTFASKMIRNYLYFAR
jgi:hypothetical protein